MPQELPERPNLEQLKKQAKSLLHAAQAGEAAALLRFAALPPFSKKSVADLGALHLALHDAQSVIAREPPQWQVTQSRSASLLTHGADVNAHDGMFAATPLVWAVEGRNTRKDPRADHVAVARLVIAAGSSVEWKPPGGSPPPEGTTEGLIELVREAAT
jgi:hypothetical protein